MAAYRQVYDSRHLQADWLPRTGISSGTLLSAIEYWLHLLFYFWLFTLSQKKICNPLAHPTWKYTTLTCEVPNFFIWLKVCIVLAFSVLAFASTCVFSAPFWRSNEVLESSHNRQLDSLTAQGLHADDCETFRIPLSMPKRTIRIEDERGGGGGVAVWISGTLTV